jgi:sugar phosphate isomerase/epimerase
MNRRSFTHSITTAALAASIAEIRAATGGKVLIGMDHFSLRSSGWKAAQYISHAAELKLDALFLSELSSLESTEETYLKQLKAQAAAAGLKLYSGGMSICKTSNIWKDTWGTPEEHVALLVRVAKTLGSPVARCVLGSAIDRLTEGGIQRHMEECIRVLKASKSRCEAEGIKISLENHAGDLQSHELKALVEAAGKGHVGVNIDPGNAVWALEEPLKHLEILGPYVNCSSVRDSVVWQSEEGAMVQWTAVGEGQVDWKAYLQRFIQFAPGVPLHIETISGFARPFAYKKESFMKAYEGMPEDMLEAWKGMAARGKPLVAFNAKDKAEALTYQKDELKRSVEALRALI